MFHNTPFRSLRLGPLEIIIILVIILVLFGASRVTKIGQNIGKRVSGSSEEDEKTPRRRRKPKKKQSNVNSRLQLFGILVVVIGIVFLAISFGVFKWVSTVGIWGLVIMAVGIVMVYIARRG
jgi:sec-independent protein translocase protein TatA